MMYYKVVGPTVIKNPSVPPDKAWVDGMNIWALGVTVLFVKFTAKHGNEYGARVKIYRPPKNCRVWPKRKLTNLELPYSWLEPLPNIIDESGWGLCVGPVGLVVIKLR